MPLATRRDSRSVRMFGAMLELGLDLVVAPIAEEAFAHDHKTPFVADDLQGARHRARPAEQEPASVGGPSGVAAGLRGTAAGARSVPVLHVPRIDAFGAMGARDERVAVAAATDVHQRQRRPACRRQASGRRTASGR